MIDFGNSVFATPTIRIANSLYRKSTRRQFAPHRTTGRSINAIEEEQNPVDDLGGRRLKSRVSRIWTSRQALNASSNTLKEEKDDREPSQNTFFAIKKFLGPCTWVEELVTVDRKQEDPELNALQQRVSLILRNKRKLDESQDRQTVTTKNYSPIRRRLRLLIDRYFQQECFGVTLQT